MIKLANGEAKEIEVNLTTKVSEIFTYVWTLCPVEGEFNLLGGFPPKPLTDLDRTVEQAGIEDSKLIQKAI